MSFINTLLRESLGIFDWKNVIKLISTKFADITEEKIEELRTKHRTTVEKGISPVDLEKVREQLNKSENSWRSPEILTSVSSAYKSLTGALDSWYQRRKDNYTKYVAKVQAEKTKSKKIKKVICLY